MGNISEIVKNLVIKANYELREDVFLALKKAQKIEKGLAKYVLSQIIENIEKAKKNKIPICQDTGLPVVFVEIGGKRKVSLDYLFKEIKEGVARGYKEGFLRESMVDPLTRKNFGEKIEPEINLEIIPGDKIKIYFLPKGFGSENYSRLFMLNPTAGIEDIKKVVISAIKEAGPNPCPPVIVGVGIGGTAASACYLAKKALLMDINHSSTPLQKELFIEINKLGIGPAGLGGKTTALGVNILTAPTHIAGLPVGINISCWCNRLATTQI